ncbi:hypothetical protein AGR4A_pAt10022 [Agrobacterium tumefaciens str. B6]|uniref:ABC transmembrane type-1 domain-containing protein n=1 Tax=Agrobacterium tumefaciens str. B6 TaxID=1183423 RepID=A0A822VAX7_AGRTU|nr:hypothetical protein AGR4A_pAt10022 [Agrobacterium tumefaciens str. B6]
MVARLTKDVEEIGEIAHHGPEDLFIAVMTLIGAFALMMWVHVPLALITVTIVPVTAIVSTFYGRRMTATWHALYGRVGSSTPVSRRMSAAFASCRRLPTRTMNGRFLRRTTAITWRRSCKPTR